MQAGTYRVRFEWMLRTAGEPDGFGQKPDVFTSQGYLWGTLEDIAANRETQKESDRQLVSAVVRLRNYPAVSPGDRLNDGADDWDVLTAVSLDNEVYCEVER